MSYHQILRSDIEDVAMQWPTLDKDKRLSTSVDLLVTLAGGTVIKLGATVRCMTWTDPYTGRNRFSVRWRHFYRRVNHYLDNQCCQCCR